MPLSASDVANKQFTTVKLREGYNMEEVDSFLDEVEAELGRLHREIDDLTAKATAAAAAPPAPAPAVVEAPVPVPVPAPAASPSDQAVRMLELAQKTADEHVAAAKTEADRLLTEARVTHQRTMGDLETERAAMQVKVEELRSFEKEYRTRLRSYLEGQLRDLDAKAVVPPPVVTGAGGNAGAAPPVAQPSPPQPAPAQPSPPQGQPASGGQQRPFSPAPSLDAPSGPPVQAD